jgi:putative copper resistance protein D
LETYLVAARLMHFSAVLLVYGGASFCVYGGTTAQRLSRQYRFNSCLIVAMCATIVSALAWWNATAVTMTGAWESAGNANMLLTVLTGTAFGQVWIWRLVLAVLLLVILSVWRSILVSRMGSILVAASAAILAASLAGTGHAVMLSGSRGIALVGAQGLHILAVGMWLGGLPALGLALRDARRYPDQAQLATLVLLLRRFSAIGTVAVLVIAATGLLSAALIVVDLRSVFLIAYGQVLLVKVLAFLLMTVLAADNRWRWTARVADSVSRNSAQDALGPLNANIGFEIGLGVLVLAFVAILGTLSPSPSVLQRSAIAESTYNG